MSSLARQLSAQNLHWIVPDWAASPRVGALFTTRQGGASTGATASMDVGPAVMSPADHAGAIGENRRRLRAFLPSDPVWLSQVHGHEIVEIDERNVGTARTTPPQADAAVTRTPGIAVAVRTADCVPMLYADRRGSVVAVAHAGWRGLAAGVLEATLAAMRVPADEIVAWSGPAIGPRAFEVGADVHAAFCSRHPDADRHFAPLRDGKWLADLPALARMRCAQCGVADVAGGEWCTFTDAQRFFSWRRDRQPGRMALVAWIADGAGPV